MKRIVLLSITGLLLLITNNNSLLAQDQVGPIQDMYERNTIATRAPLPYHHIREADMVWSKVIWRIIDLRQKMNHPLYFPTVEGMDERWSLMRLMWHGIEKESITAYDGDDDDFKIPTTIDRIKTAWGANDVSTQVMDENGNMVDTTIKGTYRFEEIQQLLIKERWYFDKQHSVMRVRILGICPIRMSYRTPGDPTSLEKAKLFWIYYPDFRDLFAKNEAFTSNNDAQRVSFDDIFTQRRFNSHIFQESNVYNNRRIEIYAPGMAALWESERIKNFLFEVEHDLWEF